MARAPHKLSGKKLAEGIGGCGLFTTSEQDSQGPKLHGKIVIAHGKRVSSDRLISVRRLETRTRDRNQIEAHIKRLVQVSRRDWKYSQRIDLSDAGILADLEKHGSKDADVPVLER